MENRGGSDYVTLGHSCQESMWTSRGRRVNIQLKHQSESSS